MNRLLCVKHLSTRDEIKLGKLLVRSDTRKYDQNSVKSEILKDIYGERKGSVYEYGLAEAFDADDLSVKLESLLNKWEKLCPGFHNWFVKKRKRLFQDSVIQSARQGSDITGLCYQNDIESLHFVEKSQQSFTKKSPNEVIANK